MERQAGVEVAVRGGDRHAHRDQHDNPQPNGDRLYRLDLAIDQDHDRGRGPDADQVHGPVAQVGQEVGQVLFEPDDAGRHDQRDRQNDRPDEQERHQLPGPVLKRLPAIQVGAARSGHRRAQFRPDQAVTDREQRPGYPTIAWGPANVATISGIVMNGPMPTICVMLIADADSRPTDRWNRRPSSRSSSAADAF